MPRVLAVMAVSLLLGCNRSASPEAGDRSGSAPAQALAKPPAPSAPFVPPEPWQPRGEGEPIAPPDLEAETWRIQVNQYRPHQRKTPHWQPLPAAQALELQMPPGSGYRCLVQPIEVAPDANDFGTKLRAWLLTRRFVCSSDGFGSWTEYGLSVRLGTDGARDVRFQSDALLRERVGGVTRETKVVLRPDKQRREATLGPPQVMAGVEVDED
jgi:hypothetical protein